jgi:predicted phage terminase large subunit-like protein
MSEFSRSVTEDGEIIFAERISPEMLALKRKVLGDYKFSCLMMNNPRNTDVQDLNVDDVRYYRWVDDSHVVLLDKENQEVDVWRLDQLDITVTIDPAPAETVNSDRNAVVTCGITPRNQVIVLDVFAQRCSPYAVIEHLIALHLMFHPRVYGVEGVAYQKIFKYVLQREAERLGIYLRIQELKAPGNKKQHVRGIQPIMRLGKLYIDATQQLLLQEMSEFPLGKHDDTVDALGLQQQLWKGRLSPEHLERVEAEARKMASQIRGYGLKHDPGTSADILHLMRQENEL